MGHSSEQQGTAPRPPTPRSAWRRRLLASAALAVAAIALRGGGPAAGFDSERDPTARGSSIRAPLDIPVPQQADWTDYGPVLESGSLGDWDFQLWGAFAASAVKRDGTFYLYYQGSCCYRIVDDSVTWRAIGVASSPDGINFAKHPSNPVITWFPNGSGEEGAVSSAVELDPLGNVVLFYGANSEESFTTVNSDGRLAISADGLAFSDQGVVIDHSDPQVWGSGDELFPVAAFEEAGQWQVYYIPNGTPQARTLGVAWGPAREQLDSSAAARSGGSAIPAWGTAGAARLGEDSWALFINDVRARRLEVRGVSAVAPDQLSAPLATYQFPDFRQATVVLDQPTRTWFMYYRNQDSSRYGVKLAPLAPLDATPPLAPPGVTASPPDHRRLELTWQPASDPDTGIAQYKIYRDGQPLATVKGWRYLDAGLQERTTYSYEVSAINYHGLEGPKSVPELLTTPADVTPPALASVAASGDPARVSVVFDEPVEAASAEEPDHYSLSHGLRVLGARLEVDTRSVTLTVDPQSEHQTYLLTVVGVVDRAQSPNGITRPLRRAYSFSAAAGLAAAWRLDDGSGTSATDTGGGSRDGSLDYPGRTPATWVSGRLGGALQFDGLDDLVILPGDGSLSGLTDGSHTFTGWARPASVPPNSAANNSLFSVVTRAYTGIHYDFAQNFRATLRTASGSEVKTAAGPFAPLQWHHLAMVVDHAARQLHLYVDGLEVSGSPQAYSGELADLGEAPYYIGTSDPLMERWDYRFQGLLDEIRLYDRALGGAEVAALAVDPPALEHAVGIGRSGSGTGRVTSDPPGIDCGSVCTGTFAAGTGVTLTAVADPGSSFGGWTGDSDCADGSVTVLGPRLCTANFSVGDPVIFSDGFESGDTSSW